MFKILLMQLVLVILLLLLFGNNESAPFLTGGTETANGNVIGRLNESFTHYAIIHKAFGHFLSVDELDQLYVGDFLRDLSQFFVAFPLSYLRTRAVLELIIGREFNGRISVNSMFEGNSSITWDQIGKYDPADHDENPNNISVQAGRLYDPSVIRIDANTNMIGYMSTLERGIEFHVIDSLERKLNSSLRYLNEYCTESTISNNNDSNSYKTQFLRYIGGITHTISDFYAHSNFIELAVFEELMLKENLSFSVLSNLQSMNSRVFVWVGNGTIQKCGAVTHSTNDYCFPLVSGRGSQTKEEIMDTVMSVLKSKFYNELLEGKSMVKELIRELLQMKMQQDFVKRDAFRLDSQFLYPSHFQLNKDTSDHPLHILAYRCASSSLSHFAMEVERRLKSCDLESSWSKMFHLITHVYVHPHHVTADHLGASACMSLVKQFVNESNNSKRLEMLQLENVQKYNYKFH